MDFLAKWLEMRKDNLTVGSIVEAFKSRFGATVEPSSSRVRMLSV